MEIHTGRVSQIDQMKASRNGGAFLRVYFQMRIPPKVEFGKTIPKSYFWAKTDLVPGVRNFKRWDGLAVKGNVLKNLQLKTENTVDADSFPELVGNLDREPDIIPLQKSLWK